MNPILTLLPGPGALADADADRRIAAATAALASGDPAGLPDADATCVTRMQQAIDKIGSDAQIRRIGELITLAQFGAGSAGTLISAACNDAAAAGRCEGCLIGFFLTDVAANADTLPHLLPSSPSGASYEEILQRASNALKTPGTVSHRGMNRYLAVQSAFARRQIAKLEKYGAGDPRAALTGFDRLVVRLRLLLRLEPGS